MRVSHLTLRALIATLVAVGAHAATFTVTSTDDAGEGSLRDAIDQANATPGADQIVFDISGVGPHVIEPVAPLVLNEAVTIDGTSQDGIVLDGASSSAIFGLTIASVGSTVTGLEIRSFPAGVYIGSSDPEVPASSNTMKDNLIHSNANVGLMIESVGPTSSSDNTIEDNVIRSNGGGLLIQAVGGGTCSGNLVRNNEIRDNPSAGLGLAIFDVGGSSGTTASANVIRANRIHNNGSSDGDGGLWMGAWGLGESGGNTTTLSGNIVEDNHIRGNALHGLWLMAGKENGGDALVTGNRIANNTIEANSGWGVEFLGIIAGLAGQFNGEDGTVADNDIQGNTFADNGLGEINWPEGTAPTAVQSTTWGMLKFR